MEKSTDSEVVPIDFSIVDIINTIKFSLSLFWHFPSLIKSSTLGPQRQYKKMHYIHCGNMIYPFYKSTSDSFENYLHYWFINDMFYIITSLIKHQSI